MHIDILVGRTVNEISRHSKLYIMHWYNIVEESYFIWWRKWKLRKSLSLLKKIRVGLNRCISRIKGGLKRMKGNIKIILNIIRMIIMRGRNINTIQINSNSICTHIVSSRSTNNTHKAIIIPVRPYPSKQALSPNHTAAITTSPSNYKTHLTK